MLHFIVINPELSVTARLPMFLQGPSVMCDMTITCNFTVFKQLKFLTRTKLKELSSDQFSSDYVILTELDY